MQLKTNRLSRANRNYCNVILNSNPYSYYRFKETSGTALTDSSNNNITATADKTITLNRPSLLVNDTSDKAALFTTNGNVQQNASFTGTSAFTIECLFQTATTNGALIWCSNNKLDTNTSSWDKTLYIENGNIKLFTYPGFNLTLTSPLQYNDIKKHIVSATCGNRGQELWIDGVLVATNTYTTSQVYNPASWHVGYGRWNGGNGYFNGVIDEVSMVHSQISTSTIQLRHKHAGF